MPTYLSPGVYMEEVSSGSKPIEGVGTAVAAFVGFTEKGPANEPALITNWTQFTSTFGSFADGYYLPHAVYGYFLNGGGTAYVVRVGGDDGAAVAKPVARAELPSAADKKNVALRFNALEAGETGDALSVEVADASEPGEETFKIIVRRGNKVEETFDNVTTRRGPQ
ncbi:MAG: phage tail sheath family protein, partial [Acidimicrobiales bacterium]